MVSILAAQYFVQYFNDFLSDLVDLLETLACYLLSSCSGIGKVLLANYFAITALRSAVTQDKP